jgi:TonB-linked SusC/RagA family outer membrane protein
MKSLILSIFLIFAGVVASAQTYEIKGTVADASGNPLPGVTVVVKNSTKGASTDFDGNFTIPNINNGETLVFSYIGFVTQEIIINDANALTVVLDEDTESLEEVVVIGYGTQKKSVVTGAISSVKASDLQGLPVERVEHALQGRVAGVTIAMNSGQPGSDATVRVRGLTTFDTNGGNNPLWVIDGVIVEQAGIGFLNQSDIASIEVLKDAASLAIYGARAASGVLIITTKKGKVGKISANYTGFVGISGPAKKLNLLNAPEYAAIMNERSVGGGGPVVYPDINAYGVGTDWQEAIFNDSAMRYSHEVSLSGGNDVSSFFASFGLTDQEGIVSSPVSQFNRKNIRLNSTHKLNEYVTIGQTLGYAHKRSMGVDSNNEFGGPLISAINLDPITPLVVTDPVVANSDPYIGRPVFRDANGNPYGISNIVGQEMTNPIAHMQPRLGNHGWSDDFIGNAFVEVTPIEGLIFKSSLGAKLSYWGDEGFTPVHYLSANSDIIRNSLWRNRSKGYGWNLENTVSYTRDIGEHNFSVLLGQGVYIDGISSGVNVTYNDVPFDTRHEATFNVFVTDEQKTSGSWTGTDHKVTSLFSRLTYNYAEKYLFTGIIRRDGSSRFGANNRYGVFPSFSTGWVASKEDFWPENDVVNTLKIRGGYGVTGNDAIGDFGYLALIGDGRNYPIGPDGSTIIVGNSPNAPENPDLKWEETAQTNIGFEARLLSSLNLTFDYFLKETTGILQTVDIPGYVGASGSPLGNVADMENSGIEVELGYRKDFGDLKFSANGNFSYIKNEVTFLGEGKDVISGGAGAFIMGDVTRTKVGLAYNSFYGYQTNGIFQNMAEVSAYTGSNGPIQPDAVPGDFKWVDNNGDGEITDADKVVLGSPLPKYTFGLTLNFAYEGFDLMLFTQGVAGNKIFQGLRRLDLPTANYQKVVLSRWTGEGTSNDYPRLSSNDPNENFGKFSDFYLEKGDFLRLKTVQLGYSLPENISSKIGAQKLRLFVTGENLLTLTEYTGFDPEIGGNVFGIDKGYYPQARSIMFGVNLQF